MRKRAVKSMVFTPFARNHAIIEVVFGITFSRSFSAEEMASFFSLHDYFKGQLPGISHSSNVPFQLSFGGQPVPFTNQGISFERYNSAGGLEQRLRIEGNTIFVNCLVYNGWENVSADAFALIDSAVLKTIKAPIKLKSTVLQYLNSFSWTGQREDYQLDELLKRNSGYFPNSVFDRGYLWHLHQGWYETKNLPENGRVLQRITSDGVETGHNEIAVRIDCYQGYELTNEFDFAGLNERISGELTVANLFSYLHDQCKLILAACFSDKVQNEIGIR